MSYKVSFWNAGAAAQPAKFYMSRSQAVHGMKRYAYDRLEAFALLDTKAAHNVMAMIERCDDILPPQDQRHVEIANTGYSMNLSNTARQAR
jgi:hypothetical protein